MANQLVTHQCWSSAWRIAVAAVGRAQLFLHKPARAWVAALSSIDFQFSIDLPEVEASELAVTAVLHAMCACPFSGYRNDTDVGIGATP